MIYILKGVLSNLVAVCKTSHTTHDTEDIVVRCVDTDLSSLGSLNSGVGEYKLKGCVVNA